MKMTEEHARTKWCPHMRQPACMPDGTSVAVNFLPADNGPDCRGNCIASDCMAWRWDDGEGPEYVESLKAVRMKKVATGYCGLAG